MSIIRTKKTDNFTTVCNDIFRRPDISARAKGVYAYIMTLPNDWKIVKTDLHKHFKEGRDAINNAFEELEKAGYIEKQPSIIDGQLNGWDYTVYETSSISRVTENPSDGKSVRRETRMTENPSLLNTNILNTNILKSGERAQKPVTFKTMTEQQFIDECNSQAILDSSERQKFISYWSEKSASGKMRFQMQQTWETSRRMATWKSRNNSFVAKSASQAKPFSAPDADERYKGL